MTREERIKKVKEILIDSIKDIDDLDLLERITDFIDEQQYDPSENEDED